jgi:hypothetical protein
MTAVPVPNSAAAVEERDGGLVVLVALSYPGWLRGARRLLKLRPCRRYRLDGVGLDVYRRLDGRRNLADLAQELREEHRLTFYEARALILGYVRTLMSKGLVVLAAPDRNE